MERRGDPRAEISTTAIVTVRHNAGVAFLIESISISGARLVGPLTLTIGERIGILFQMDSTPIDVSAEVIRVQSFDLDSDRVAVRFTKVADTARVLIRDLVARGLDLEEEQELEIEVEIDE